MTIAAYQTLYESSVAFGMRKALQAEQGKADMEKRVRTPSYVIRYDLQNTMMYRTQKDQLSVICD